MATKKANEAAVEIRPIEEVTFQVRVVGDTPLIVHNWSEKAKRQLLEKMQGTSKGKTKDPKNPPVYPRPLEYVADFTYMEVIEGMTQWRRVVEDVKSPATRKNPVYKIKKRLLYQTYGLEIKEV